MRRPAFAGIALAAAIGLLAGCSDTATFEEPNGVVIWSTDDRPPVLPADSPARGNPEMSVDQLVRAAVLGDDGERIILVGDMYDWDGSGHALGEDGTPHRVAYLLDGESRMLLLLGVLDRGGGSNMWSGFPGRRVGAALDTAATSARIYDSAGVRTMPVYTDPETGQVLTFATARAGETLYGLHALDDAGRVTNIVGIAP